MFNVTCEYIWWRICEVKYIVISNDLIEPKKIQIVTKEHIYFLNLMKKWSRGFNANGLQMWDVHLSICLVNIVLLNIINTWELYICWFVSCRFQHVCERMTHIYYNLKQSLHNAGPTSTTTPRRNSNTGQTIRVFAWWLSPVLRCNGKQHFLLTFQGGSYRCLPLHGGAGGYMYKDQSRGFIELSAALLTEIW